VCDLKQVKKAVVSVYHKEGLEPILKILNNNNVEIFSTGGTADFIKQLGYACTEIESITDYPAILGGRVKTLHPKVFGGILARTSNSEDIEQVNKYNIPLFDLVIVDLYPFSQTVASGANEEEIIEKIDIGGISLIRAAAKNHKDVLIVSNRNQYADLLSLLQNNNCKTSISERRKYASKAFFESSNYDKSIYSYFAGIPNILKLNSTIINTLRYGENPHQQGYFLGDFSEIFEKLNGKEISYNNILDIDASIDLIKEFNEPTIAIIKHNNACGLASREKLCEAWKDALSADPISAFGGVIITNKTVDYETALEMNSLFFEILIAPNYDEKGLSVLQEKKNRIILKLNKLPEKLHIYRNSLNGILVQQSDSYIHATSELNYVTNIKPDAKQIDDLLFANKLVKHTKSNAIVLVKNKQLIAGIGGQTSRVDALKQAIIKAGVFKFDLNGAVMASDAFFPFPDCVEIAHKAGITSVIQPGGSIKDNDSIEYCNKNNISMVLTGKRHFRH